MKNGYQKTIYACFLAYIVQAIVNNFVPLLFLTFQDTYDIPLSKITMLVTINFGLQLLVDLGSVGFVDKIGYRASMVIAHVFAAAGLGLLALLPDLLPDPPLRSPWTGITRCRRPWRFWTGRHSYNSRSRSPGRIHPALRRISPKIRVRTAGTRKHTSRMPSHMREPPPMAV